MSTEKGTRVARSAGLGAAIGSGTVWLTAPHLAIALTMIQAALAIIVILTALYAPEMYSGRAFRLLPWAARNTMPSAETKEP